MQFLFVSPNLCRQLPSDSASQRTPLLLANAPYCKAHSGLAPYREYVMPDAHEKRELIASFFIQSPDPTSCP